MYSRHVNEGADEVEHVRPSCMWGFVHAIDYHQWHLSLKRMLLQKINPVKRIKGSRNSRQNQLLHDPGQQQKLLHEKEKHQSSGKESRSKHKKSLKARIKSLIAEETPKEGKGKQHGSSISSQPKFQRTYSIHHLEPPGHGFGEICTDWEHPVLFFPSNKQSSAERTLPKMNDNDERDAYGKNSKVLSNSDASKEKEHGKVLEIFKLNKDSFLEIVQDKDGTLRKFSHALTGSNAKARLSKSGSFPGPGLIEKRSLEPSTLKQKQSETWSGLKGEKFSTDRLMLNLEKFKRQKHVRSKSLPLECIGRGSKLGQALNFILENTSDSDKVNKEVPRPSSTESKQSDHFELKEGRNQANPSDISDLGEVSSGNVSSKLEEYPANRTELTAESRAGEENSFSCNENKDHSSSRSARIHRRSSSLNESMEKYTWLFENNFGKEVKLQSRSLRLRNEYDVESAGDVSSRFRRIRSVSSADIYSSFYGDDNFDSWPITTVDEESSSCEKDSCQDEMKPGFICPNTEEVQGDNEESIHRNELQEREECTNQIDNFGESRERVIIMMEDLEGKDDVLTVGKSTLYTEQDNYCSAFDPCESPQPSTALAFESYFEEDVSRSLEFQASEGSDHFDDKESSINHKNSFDTEPSALLSSKTNPEHMKDAELVGSYSEYNADLDYVKDVLETSGFSKDAFHKTWHTSNQPLDPLVFDEMEAYWHKECSAQDYCGCNHHQLLFDVVNEKLFRLYERSFTYYPEALSSSCYIRPFPVGEHFVDEICTSVNTLTRLKTEQKQSLECLVALDMGKDDGWMNLQLESECLGLDIEDILFDELLEELLSS